MTRIREDDLVDILISKGYDEESAIKVLVDVTQAKRESHEKALKEFIGKRVKVEFGEMWFDVVVEDMKFTKDGYREWLVTPLNGNKSAWVRKFIK